METITVKQARLMSGITQGEMAKKMGIHVQTYRKIESNPSEATIRQADQISSITGREFNQIFFGMNSTKSRDDEFKKTS